MKQSHKLYASYLNKCFETYRPTEFEIGVKLLNDKANTVEDAKYQIMNKRQSVDLNSTQIYMPKLIRPSEINKHQNLDLNMIPKRNLNYKLNRSDIL